MKIREQSDHQAFICEGLDFTFPLVHCPEGKDDLENPVNRATLRGLNALLKFNEEAEKLAADKNLSPEGRNAALEAHRPRFASAVKERQAELAPIAAEAKQAIEKLYAIPKLDPTDAVCGQRDQELRHWFYKDATALERADILRGLGEPENEPYLLALLRDPVNRRNERNADNLPMTRWRERIETSHLKQATALRLRAESVAWAEDALARMAASIGSAKVRVRVKTT